MMTWYYNSKVPKHLIPRDMVLRNTQITGVEKEKGKLTSKWSERSYVTKEEIRSGTYMLVGEDGNKKNV